MFNEFPYTSYEKINLDWLLDLGNKLKADAESGAFNGPRGPGIFGITTIYAEMGGYYCNKIGDAGVGDFVIGYGPVAGVNTLYLMKVTSVSGNYLEGTTLLQITGPQGPQGQQGEPGEVTQVELNKLKNPEENYSIGYVDALPDNLIKKEELFRGYYINTSGVPAVGNDWSCSPFIYIGDYSQLKGKNIGLGAYYDESYKFLSSVTVGNSSVNPPASAKFIRVSILQTNINSAILSYHGFYDFPADYPVSVWKSPKKPYEAGFIRFTVPVNTTAATYDSTAETNTEGTPNYVNVDCVLTLPYRYKPIGEPCKLLMMCHGAGRGVSGEDNWTTNAGYLALVDIFKTKGYAIFDCNGFQNDALGWSFWGNQRGLEAWRKAYLYITDNYNVEKTFSIYAFSMGGLTAMNLAFQGFPNINAIALGSPVLDLHEAWNATDGTKDVIKTLYGLGSTWDESKVVGNNPYKHLLTIGGETYCPFNLPPIKIWYGSTETNNVDNPAIEKEKAKSFVNAVTNSGGYAFYREVSGRGHEICYGNSSVVNNEIATFLERYERSVPTYN